MGATSRSQLVGFRITGAAGSWKSKKLLRIFAVNLADGSAGDLADFWIHNIAKRADTITSATVSSTTWTLLAIILM